MTLTETKAVNQIERELSQPAGSCVMMLPTVESDNTRPTTEKCLQSRLTMNLCKSGQPSSK